MNMITQFKTILEKNLITNFNDYLFNISKSFDNPFSIDSYKQFIEDFDCFTSNLTRDTYMALIQAIDQDFMDSNTRKQSFESKGFVIKHNFLTKFGPIDFKRRRYVNKDTNESFMYVDRLLGLDRYVRMDPFVVAELCEESSSNSYAMTGRIVSKSIGTRVKYDDDPNKFIISRATCRNSVIKAHHRISTPETDVAKVVPELTIILDEKFIPSQFNNGLDHMVKACVVYEGTYLEYKNRSRLLGKHVFGSIDNDLLSQVMDYIYFSYDTDKLKKINIMGDGASWIKSFALDSSFKYHKDLIIKYGLDHFHLSQAIQHITTNKYRQHYKSIIDDYIIHDRKDDFITICKSIISLDPSREDTINSKMDYILNNWQYIQNYFHDIKYKCPMESNISHVFADLFTSRPKAYSYNGLKVLLIIRLLKVNGFDLKKLYFDGSKKLQKQIKEDLLYNNISINHNVSDSHYTRLPILDSSSISSKKISNLINSFSI